MESVPCLLVAEQVYRPLLLRCTSNILTSPSPTTSALQRRTECDASFYRITSRFFPFCIDTTYTLTVIIRFYQLIFSYNFDSAEFIHREIVKCWQIEKRSWLLWRGCNFNTFLHLKTSREKPTKDYWQFSTNFYRIRQNRNAFRNWIRQNSTIGSFVSNFIFCHVIVLRLRKYPSVQWRELWFGDPKLRVCRPHKVVHWLFHWILTVQSLYISRRCIFCLMSSYQLVAFRIYLLTV